jgi:hypothetical protein
MPRSFRAATISSLKKTLFFSQSAKSGKSRRCGLQDEGRLILLFQAVALILYKVIAESTSSVEDLSPVPASHASPEAAFPNPLDLTLAPVLHVVSFSIEDDSYCSPIAVISLISIGSVDILFPKGSNSKESLAILTTQLTDIGQLNTTIVALLPHFSFEEPCFDIRAELLSLSLQLPYLALTNACVLVHTTRRFATLLRRLRIDRGFLSGLRR